MPLDLQIIRASEFVRVGALERLDFQASKQALALLAQACRKRGIDRALLDLREIPASPTPRFTSAQLTALVETFKDAGFTRRQRLAVLYKTDPHRGARRFAFIGTFKGWNVRAFDDFEAALLWLSSGHSKETAPVAEPIPFQRRSARDTNVPIKLTNPRPAPLVNAPNRTRFQ